MPDPNHADAGNSTPTAGPGTTAEPPLAVPAPILMDLVCAVVNGLAYSDCLGCDACQRWAAAAKAAVPLLPTAFRRELRDFAARVLADAEAGA